MKKIYMLISILVIYTNCSDYNAKFTEPNLLKEEFDLCAFWHDGMSWNDFRAKRNQQHHKGLIKYVDKIQQQEIAHEKGVLVPKTYVASNTKVPLVSLLNGLTSYVAKATHLSLSGGLIIVKNGIDIITGQPISSKEVETRMFELLKQHPRQVESWALHQVKPGFIVQEYIPKRNEIKVQTIWGKAVIGEWRGGEDKKPTTKVWGRYDRQGRKLMGDKEAPSYWPQVIKLAEVLAEKTDALRVDFLIDDTLQPPRIMLNEMEIWPESNWASSYDELGARLNAGYRGKCRVLKP